ncbi:MAG: YfiR/HmsC family protein [Myxococcales bacterium]|nr:YfiR/HmsC family protein [Myxococcales bacterium]MDP3500720.1 YfiR/HmsC family protein [Myxococcales bacterium]
MKGLAALLTVALALPAFGQPAQEVPPRLAMLVLLKVLTYDAGFEARGQGDFVVTVPFSPGREGAADALLGLLGALEIKTIKQRKLVFQRLPVATTSSCDAVVVSAALDADGLRQALERSRAARQYSLALDEAMVREGALLGVASLGGKLQPVLNVSMARATGVEFSASILKLVRTVQSP